MLLVSVAVTLAIFYLFHLRPFGFAMIDREYLFLLLAMLLPLAFVWLPLRNKSPLDRVPWYDIALVLISLGIPFYFYTRNLDIQLGGLAVRPPPEMLALSIIFWLAILEAGRRAAGPIFFVLMLFFSTYPLFASSMPGFLNAANLPLGMVAGNHVLSDNGILSITMRATGELFIGFMIFSVFLQTLGAGRFFTDIASALLSKTRAGNSKISIVSSGFFGMISGSGISNVYVTGSFTIPAMKREGIHPEIAAGIEAAASSAGGLMPPVMGIAAFLMVEFTGVSYAEVAIAAVVPSILYYLCMFVQIDAHAARAGIKPKETTVEVPHLARTMLDNLHIILGFLVLIFVLFYWRLISQAPFWAAGVVLLVALLRRHSRVNPWRFTTTFLEQLARFLGELTAILAALGLMIGGLVVTGVSFALPYEIIRLAGGNVYLLLFTGAVAALILGMGVPLSASYIFLAFAVAPALVAAGFDLVAAHLFVMYCALWSDTTPPVALTAFAASKLAGSDPMRTAMQSMKLGIARYLVPFFFILSPALILRGAAVDALMYIPGAIAGLTLIGGALEGYFWKIGKLTVVLRIVLFAAGVLLAIPETNTDLYGILILTFVFVLAMGSRRRPALHKLFVVR